MRGGRSPTHTGCVAGDHQPTRGAWREITNPHGVRGGRSPTHTGCVVGDHQPTQGVWQEITNPHRVRSGRSPTHTGCVAGDHQPTRGVWWEIINPHGVRGGRSPAPSRKELNYNCKTSYNHLKVKLMLRARVKTYCMNYPFFSSTILTLNTLPATTLEADNFYTKLQTFTS